ncbi:MAG: helix-turn-helix domain-containing protein [Deltaproteobacteria bacterium]|nr:helix-turn-helix domain-containing protein [Deltaproteobacteria bacterium]MBW2697099.1 helix-turn-helix domain-containing protein [Deltaproteobacteria bacterium]
MSDVLLGEVASGDLELTGACPSNPVPSLSGVMVYWLARANSRSPSPVSKVGTLADIERRCIVQAITKTGFNRTHAAGLLDVTRRTLSYRISEYGLEEELEEMRQKSRSAIQPSLPNLGPPPAA